MTDPVPVPAVASALDRLPEAAMIFAAGFGTRMGGLTRNTPKPLLRAGGRTLLDRALSLVTDAGITRIAANGHYLGEQVEAALRPTGAQYLKEEVILETGGGLRAALPVLGRGPVVTLNPDAIFLGSNPIRALCDAWEPDRMDALLAVVPLANTRAHGGTGDFALVDGRLSRGGAYVYTGAQVIKTNRLAEVPETAFSLNRLWDLMAAEGRLCGLAYGGDWVDVGTPKGLQAAEDAF
ncbi:MAG: nucleotidyltransferase family protein [Pseudomonadota bacterium]